ncbi:hypothetical protein EUGRSUZ_B01782 [Eucalyptus grandis]|uniref:Uncharacterized protein n=2 Tax=Eucalyptus grandis TaxID=71139 RepID=A0ACC3LS83_EUCGR|nr:hypothetical protein EUGRSUZ_B01782 [Eucalyptus grandis]
MSMFIMNGFEVSLSDVILDIMVKCTLLKERTYWMGWLLLKPSRLLMAISNGKLLRLYLKVNTLETPH